MSDYAKLIHCSASPERVFEALTTLPGLAGWWAPVTGSGTEGGELRFTFRDPEPLVLRVSSAQEPSSVIGDVQECAFLPMREWEGTTVSFTLSQSDTGGCDLQFRHHGLTPRLQCYPDCSAGWDHFLASLRDYVDFGRGSPFQRSPAPAQGAPEEAADQTQELVQAYYASWIDGLASFDEARLRSILAPDLHFEGPIAGRRDGLEPFLAGLAGFVRALSACQMVQQMYTGDEAAALYDCELGASEGTLRFAEFFRVQNGKIREIRLLYDATAFRCLMAA